MSIHRKSVNKKALEHTLITIVLSITEDFAQKAGKFGLCTIPDSIIVD